MIRPLMPTPGLEDGVAEWKTKMLSCRKRKHAEEPSAVGDTGNSYDFFYVIRNMEPSEIERTLKKSWMFLELLGDMQDQLVSRLETYLPDVLLALCFYVALTSELDTKTGFGRTLMQTSKQTRQLVYKRLTTTFRRYPTYVYPTMFLQVLPNLIAAPLQNLKNQPTGVSPILTLLGGWCVEAALQQFYYIYPNLLPSLLPMLVHPKLDVSVAHAVVKILVHLTASAPPRCPIPSAWPHPPVLPLGLTATHPWVSRPPLCPTSWTQSQPQGYS